MPLQATSGAASYDAFGGGVAAVPNYIEDVFSTWLYTGNGSTQTITNGIDLAGKGGMTWIKQRSATRDNLLFDTTRGATQRLFSNLTLAQSQDTQSLTAFNANGFSIGSDSGCNINGGTYASWTFREQPKFFDVVTYTGNGVAGRTVAHNLGSVPGCIIVKRTDGATNWRVYHRSLGATQYLDLDEVNAAASATTIWNDTAPTSTVFSVGTNSGVNASGGTYVAYLFAHNAGGFGLSGTDNVISCGSLTTDGSGVATVNLGYEPQWVLFKTTGVTGSWGIKDSMRGIVVDPAPSETPSLYADVSDAESQDSNIQLTSTGFKTELAPSKAYIYIAIRRGPMRTPTTGTSVFTPVARSGTGSTSTVSNGITTDLIISMTRNTGQASGVWDRLRGFPAYLETNGTATESTSSDSVTAMNNTAYVLGADGGTDRINRSGYTYANWTFSRAPGFFDVCCYTGTGANRTVAHNLAAVPELMLVKRRSTVAESWAVYSATIGNTRFLRLDSTLAATTSADRWNNTSPTSSVFTVGIDSEVNASSQTYVAYLFASVPGVSKVGSYTGTGTTQTINCGFTAGSRFVLIKRTDSTGDWYVWDTARGIVSGNDPHLSLNTTAAEVTSNDTIDTDSTGFVVNQVSATNVNVSSATYIFMAVA